jgi:hypothetical protein
MSDASQTLDDFLRVLRASGLIDAFLGVRQAMLDIRQAAQDLPFMGDGADAINGHVFHVEKGRINTYYYGEDFKTLTNDGSVFTVDQLIAQIPSSIMSGITPVVPAVKREDAVKSAG